MSGSLQKRRKPDIFCSVAQKSLGFIPLCQSPNETKIMLKAVGGNKENENAVKIARMFTGRNKVFSRYRSYHGSSFGAGNLTGEPRKYALEPGIPGFVKFFDPYVYA